MVVDTPDVSVLMEIVPLAAPALVGRNRQLNITALPGAIVCVEAKPVMLNPGPETLAPETVNAVLPTLARVTTWELELPTEILPKLITAGEAFSWPCLAPVVPLNGTVIGACDVFQEKVRDPENGPEAWGVTRITTVTLWPLGIENDDAPASKLNPVPELDWDTCAASVPILVRMIGSSAVLPRGTEPKETFETLAVNMAPEAGSLVVLLEALAV
jgi:hypothetical protein